MGLLENILGHIQNHPEVRRVDKLSYAFSNNPKLILGKVQREEGEPYNIGTMLEVYPKKGLYSPKNLGEFMKKLIPSGITPSSIIQCQKSSHLEFTEELGRLIRSTDYTLEGEELIRIFGNKEGFNQWRKQKKEIVSYVYRVDVFPKLSSEEIDKYNEQLKRERVNLLKENFGRILRGEKSKNVVWPNKRK